MPPQTGTHLAGRLFFIIMAIILTIIQIFFGLIRFKSDVSSPEADMPVLEHHEEKTTLNSSLVIIMGNLRGGEQAWESLYKNVLDINSADLALIIGQTNTTSNNLYQNSSLYTRAKYIWTFNEYDDWADAIDLINGTTWRKTHLPHVSNMSGLLGGVKGHEGSGAIIFMIRWFLSQRLLHNPDILNRYERFVITRADYYYQCQHEYKNLNLSNSTIWIPEGEDYGGYTDRHTIVSRSDVLDALDILPTLLQHRRDLGEHWLSENPETALKLVWTSKGINVNRTKRVMFTAATKFDTTRWQKPFGDVPGVPGLLKKYHDEYNQTQVNCLPAIESKIVLDRAARKKKQKKTKKQRKKRQTNLASSTHEATDTLPQPTAKGYTDKRCTFCERVMLQPCLVVPETDGNTCESIKSMAGRYSMSSDVCPIIKKQEMVCCPQNGDNDKYNGGEPQLASAVLDSNRPNVNCDDMGAEAESHASECRFKDTNMGLCHFIPYGSNFGDEIGPLVSKKLVEDHFNCKGDSLPVWNLAKGERKGTCLFSLGSIFHMVEDGDHIWGTGVNPTWQRQVPGNLNIHAVRGPHTEDFLNVRGVLKESVGHGDPGLLLPLIFPASIDRGSENRFCFVAHAQDKDIVNRLAIKKDRLSPAVHVIHAQAHLPQVVDSLLTCSHVASTSLHGLILADAFGIPSRWFQFPNSKTEKTEGHFKYQDYYSTIGRDNATHAENFEDVFNTSTYWEILAEGRRHDVAQTLKSTFPYHLFYSM